ncbi:MAG: hypothetical protein IJ908_09085 [Fibrobacter sp.]|nr:hypothetical protein [Fibrobacter sp.]
MSRISAYILFLSLFLLAACDSAKKEFETLKEGEILIDVNSEEYSLNGTVIGKTATDISAIDDFIDKPLHKEVCRVRTKFQEDALRRGESGDGFDFAKLHVDGNLSYGDFYKAFSSMFFCGYSVFDIAIGSNYRDVFRLSIPSTNYMWCGLVILRMKGLRYKYLRNRQKLSIGEILDMHTKGEEIEKECYEKYSSLDLLLSFYPKDDGFAYVVSLNETFFNESRPFDGFNFYTFDDDADLWKFIENVRSKVESKNGDRRDRVLALLDGRKDIELVFEKDIPMKEIAPIVKKLKTYGYRFVFSIAN